MSPIELEEIGTTGCDVVSNRADLRRDIHVFVGYVGEHEVKRGHRDNQLPAAHRQRLARLMSDPAQAGQTDENGISPWIGHVDEVCLALQLVGYDTEGSYAGWSSSSASFPDNFIQRKGAEYEQFLDLPLAAQEERIRAIPPRWVRQTPQRVLCRGPVEPSGPVRLLGFGHRGGSHHPFRRGPIEAVGPPGGVSHRGLVQHPIVVRTPAAP